MPRVYHFEINADEPEKISDFYSEVFGWMIQKKWIGEEDYWLIFTGGPDEKGINGGIKKRVHKDAKVVATIEVPNLDEYVARLGDAGGKCLSPKLFIEGTGTLMYCSDPEGNVFSMMERQGSIR